MKKKPLTQRSSWRRREAARRRRDLKAALGNECELCEAKYRLEFDHREKREWDATKYHRLQRMRFYEREAAAGLIRLLCRKCNASSDNWPPEEWEELPP